MLHGNHLFQTHETAELSDLHTPRFNRDWSTNNHVMRCDSMTESRSAAASVASGPGFDTCGAASALILHTETARARAPRPIRPPARCVLGSGSLPLY